MSKFVVAASIAAILLCTGPVTAAPDNDRVAIDRLLATYTDAVSHKNQGLFETLLLGKDIPFAYVPATPTKASPLAWRDYESFRRGVFEGAPFTQTFHDVHVRVHGALADIDLVYVNTDAKGAQLGYKTMQLVRVSGSWKIASEFFTGLPGGAD